MIQRFVFLFCLFITSAALAEEEIQSSENTISKWSVGFNAGTNTNSPANVSYNFIRAVNNYYYADETIESYSDGFYAGLTVERLLFNDNFGLITGINYQLINNSISAYDNYFYLLFEETDNYTNYLRVSEVNENLNFIGVPLEFRIYPLEKRVFNLFFGLGAECYYMFKSNGMVKFYSQSMDIHEEEVLDKFPESDSYYISAYATAGIRLDFNVLRADLGLVMPSFFINKYKSLIDFNRLSGGINFKLSYPF